jgi:hypothetical protein
MSDGDQSMAQSARAQAEAVRSGAAGGIGELAGALRKAASEMDRGRNATVASLTQNAADNLERLSKALRSKDVNALVRDTESFARSQPALFLGAAVAAGFLAMRFLKSSNETNLDETRRI